MRRYDAHGCVMPNTHASNVVAQAGPTSSPPEGFSRLSDSMTPAVALRQQTFTLECSSIPSARRSLARLS